VQKLDKKTSNLNCELNFIFQTITTAIVAF